MNLPSYTLFFKPQGTTSEIYLAFTAGSSLNTPTVPEICGGALASVDLVEAHALHGLALRPGKCLAWMALEPSRT